MSEKININHEQGEQITPEEAKAHIDKLHNKLERELTEAEKGHGTEKHVESAHKTAEHHAHNSNEISHAEKHTQTSAHHPARVGRQLKDMAYSRALTRARKHLSYPSRQFSKVIHSPLIDKPSEAIGKTVARPSGMLGGALFAAVGTSILLWVTKKYGYEYNYLAVILLFLGGLFVGLLTEGIYKLTKRK